MYEVTPNYENLVYGSSRIIRGKATLGGVALQDTGAIQTISITHPAVGDALMGSALSAKITLTALDPSGQLMNVKDGAELSVSLGVENESTGAVEWVPFQTVTCDSVEYDPDSKSCTVSGFDSMALLDSKTFKDAKITYPATLRQIVEKAAAVQGLSVSFQPFFMEDTVYTQASPANLGGDETLRQVIAWAAEAALSNAIIGRDGKIHFISMIPGSPVSTIDAKDYFAFEPNSVFGPINTFVLGRLPQEDNVFREDSNAVAHDGSKELRINDNPFLDLRRDDVIDQYFAKVNGLQVIPYTLDWRGNPAIDPGDTIQVVNSKDKPVTVLFGNSEIEFDGGLRFETALEIKSLTETDKSKATSVRETVRKTQLEVDKANQTITAIVEKTEGYDTQFSEIRQDLESITSTVSSQIGSLQEQIDGQIQTWFYDYIPSSSNAPANSWTTTQEKNNHLGDLFYIVNNSTAGGRAYRWALIGSVYQWVLIEDEDVAKALADAAKAQDTADGKRRVFVSQPKPPYDIGDLWTQGVDGDIMRCKVSRQSGNYVASDWVKASKYTDDAALENFVDNTYSPTITGMKQETSEIKQTVDKISSTVSSIEIGGANLQLGTQSWDDTAFYDERQKEQFEIVEDYAILKVDTYPQLSFIPVEINQKYTLSVDIKADSDLTSVNFILLGYFDSDQTGNRVAYSYINKNISTGWQRVSHTFTVPNNAEIKYLSVGPRNLTNPLVPIYFRKLKVEKGNQATAWCPAFDDIYTDTNNAIQNVYTDMHGSIEIKSDQILAEVSKTTYTKNDPNDPDETVESIASSIVQQNNNSLEIKFTDLQNGINSNKEDLNNYQNLVETYIRFTSSGIELGENNSPFSAKLGTDKLAFLQDGQEIAYISNNKLYITNAEVLDRFTIGNPISGYFDWIPRANGNLGMKWRES